MSELVTEHTGHNEYNIKSPAMITQILLNSIISALLLALVAIGFNLIFNSTRVFHLAHGALYVAAPYCLNEFIKIFSQSFPYGVASIISILLALIVISILILLIEYLVYRPLYKRQANAAISLISSLGVYIFVVNLIIFFFGNNSISIKSSYNVIIKNNYFKFTDIELVHLIISLILLAGVYIFSRSTLYQHIRAITDNYSIATKFGINVQRTRNIALVAGTLLAGIAGIMKGYEIAIEPNAGLTITLTASVAVIVGGLTSLKGTLISCFLIALIENFSVRFFSSQWKDMLIYILLIVVLVFFKRGLISVKQRIETR